MDSFEESSYTPHFFFRNVLTCSKIRYLPQTVHHTIFPSAVWARLPELTKYGLKRYNYTIFQADSVDRPDMGRN